MVCMGEVQDRIAELQGNGWTLAALADEVDVTVNAVEKWKAGDRNPSNARAVVVLLDQLAKRKRIPKKRRYTKNSRTKQSLRRIKANRKEVLGITGKSTNAPKTSYFEPPKT